MNHRLSVVPIIALLLAAPLTMASAATIAASAKTATTHAHTVKQKKKQKRIAQIQTRIARLERLKTILLSKSETMRLAKAARVGSQVRKLQARLASLKG